MTTRDLLKMWNNFWSHDCSTKVVELVVIYLVKFSKINAVNSWIGHWCTKPFQGLKLTIFVDGTGENEAVPAFLTSWIGLVLKDFRVKLVELGTGSQKLYIHFGIIESFSWKIMSLSVCMDVNGRMKAEMNTAICFVDILWKLW